MLLGCRLTQGWVDPLPSRNNTALLVGQAINCPQISGHGGPEGTPKVSGTGVCSSVLDTNPSGVDGGSGRGGGGVRGQSKIFLHFGGHS